MSEENSFSQLQKGANTFFVLFFLFTCISTGYVVENFSAISKASQISVSIVIILSLLISASSYFWKPAWRLNVAFTLCTFIFIIYAFEFLLPPKKYEVIRELQNQGKRAETAITFPVNHIEYAEHRILPLAGISNTLTVLCKEENYWATYESDEHGFNNPKGLYQKDNLDVALIGDSFTHGYCVHPDQTIAANLRKKIPRTLSFGIGGAGPLLRLAEFREYVEPLRPKTVIWLETKNTIHRIYAEGRLKPYLKDKSFRQNLFERQGEIDEVLRNSLHHNPENFFDMKPTWMRRLFLVRIRDLILKSGLGNRLNGITDLGEDTTMLPDYIDILKTVKRTTESWGGKLYYVYISHTLKSGPSDHDRLAVIVKKLEIPMIDLEPEQRAHPNLPILYPKGETGAHFGAKGYEFAADLILKAIQ